MAEPDRTVYQYVGVVRPTMRERVTHRDEPRLVYALVRCLRNGYTADSTHNCKSQKLRDDDRRHLPKQCLFGLLD